MKRRGGAAATAMERAGEVVTMRREVTSSEVDAQVLQAAHATADATSPPNDETEDEDQPRALPLMSEQAREQEQEQEQEQSGLRDSDDAEVGNGNGPTVKKRRTKNYKWREDMAKKATGSIVVRVPPLEPTRFATWDEFIRAWTEYMAQTKTLYRRRSSCSTASWNSKHRFKEFPVPDSFQYATMAYWCTHGCIQPSRGTGVRAHLHNRFTGCTARITADVEFQRVNDTEVRWYIRVRNQISQHNHCISDDIYNCYSNNSSVPDELLMATVDDLGENAHRMGRVPPSMGPSGSDDDAQATENLPSVNGQTAENDLNSNAIIGRDAVIDEQKKIEAVVEEQKKIAMANSELNPLLDELRHTPSRVIHKRLQDVTDMVAHLLGKWSSDRSAEDRQLHFIAQTASSRASTQSRSSLSIPPPLNEAFSSTEEIDAASGGAGVGEEEGHEEQVVQAEAL